MRDNDYFPSAIDLAAQGAEQATFHERAADITRKNFGSSVFVRAVVEVSNICRENCNYCGMRRDNRALKRVRARHEQLAEMLIQHRPASVTDINIQAGEDPVAVREVVLPLIRALRRETPLGVSVCLGTLPTELYAELKSAGASIYIIKFEIGDASQYQHFAAPGTLAERLRHIRLLAESGWNVSSGFISGLPGQTVEDLIQNFKVASELPLSGCSVSPFIPGNETPLSAGLPGRAGLDLERDRRAPTHAPRLDHSRRQRAEPDGVGRISSRLARGGESRDDESEHRKMCVTIIMSSTNAIVSSWRLRNGFCEAIAAEGLQHVRWRGWRNIIATNPGRSRNRGKPCRFEITCSFLPTKNLESANRVVVTGAGIITALGAGWDINAAGFSRGQKRFSSGDTV